MPVNNTGRAGFDTNSETDLSRVDTGYHTEGYPNDPYAVPPLPHLNPNQPYRDDPSPAPYYDPYRGPVPNMFNDTDSVDVPLPSGTGWVSAGGGGGEAIPMTQLPPGGGRARSPGPQMAYDVPGAATGPPGIAGRQSPGPQAFFDDRARSPGPNAALGGGVGGTTSPAGRRSPGPQVAYDGYGPR
jgi:hypothetical protein